MPPEAATRSHILMMPLFKVDNRLIHPLEYGMYKERCVRELLSYSLDKSEGISDGFLISTNNTISTQCDIIIYQKNTLPMIDNGISNFFPIEIVKGIGEVKSTLNITKFKDALITIAKNKKMFLDRKGPKKEVRSEEFDEVFSFLICNKLNFDIGKLNFDDIYSEEPDLRMRHNLILSLQDGLLLYGMDPNDFPPGQKEEYRKRNGVFDLKKPIGWSYPHHTEGEETYKCLPRIMPVNQNEKYEHIESFLINLRGLTMRHNEYEIDILQYLTDDFMDIIKPKACDEILE